MSFSRSVRLFAQQSLQHTQDMIDAIKIELFNSVILDSPVGNPDLWVWYHPQRQQYVNYTDYRDAGGYVGGRFRGNWQTSNGSPKSGELPLRSEEEVLMEMIGAVNAQNGDGTTYLVNNLPYAQRLEEGYSTQAPTGMVRKNMARVDSIIRRASRN